MRINSINFTARLAASCQVKNAERKRSSASLYEYYPKDDKDIAEIQSSPYTDSLKYDFFKAGIKGNQYPGRFYVLKDDKTNEIVSVAQLTYHYSQYGKNKGYYIALDGIEGNGNYIDPLTPMIAYIANQAYLMDANNIQTSFRDWEAQSLAPYKFTKTPLDSWILPKARFEENIIKAEARNNIEFIA